MLYEPPVVRMATDTLDNRVLHQGVLPTLSTDLSSSVIPSFDHLELVERGRYTHVHPNHDHAKLHYLGADDLFWERSLQTSRLEGFRKYAEVDKRKRPRIRGP